MRIIKFVKDYGYDITKEQARAIVSLLEEWAYSDVRYTYDEIIKATDFIVEGKNSIFANEFN